MEFAGPRSDPEHGHRSQRPAARRFRSRAVAAALAVALHFGMLMVLVGFTDAVGIRPQVRRSPLPPLRITFIQEPRRLILTRPAALPRPPRMAQVRIALHAPVPRIHLPAPPMPRPSLGTLRHAMGAPRRGASAQAGAPITLVVSHYVAPNFPAGAARAGVHGTVVMALRVNAAWGVGDLKVLRGTGSKRLDRAAEHAARQWRFEPQAHRVPGKPLWVVVRIEFAPPQRLLGVPILIVPYAAVARRVGLLGPADRELRVPRAAATVRRMLRKVRAAFSEGATENTPEASLPKGDSIAVQLAAQGPVKSIRFLGVLRHGIAHDRTGLRGGGMRFARPGRRWEVYAVQHQGPALSAHRAVPDSPQALLALAGRWASSRFSVGRR